MHIPAPFAQHDRRVIAAFIEQHPLAVVIGLSAAGIQAAPLPLVLCHKPQGQSVLIGHMARNNPLAAAQGGQWLAVFQSGGHYITPNWYPDKQRSHQVVPTWNYQSVHIRGTMRIRPDTEAVLAMQTDAYERMLPENTPWQLNDAPAAFIGTLAQNIIAFEISVEHVQAAFKLSQNKDEATRQSVCAGLRGLNQAQSAEAADLIERFAPTFRQPETQKPQQ